MAGLSIPLGEEVHFDAVTHNPSSGAAADATSGPNWSAFEEASDTPILTGTMTKRSGLTGHYRGSFLADAGSGFEVGKFYNVVCDATVGGVIGKQVALTFRVTAAEAATGYAPLDAGERNALADAILGRDVSHVEDTAAEHSLSFVVLAMSESNTIDHAGSLTVYKTDGTREFVRKELLTGQNVQAVTGIR